MIPHYKLYSALAVGMSSFIGSPLAGGILMALNFRRLGQRARAWVAVVLSVAVALLFIAVSASTSSDNPVPGLVYIFVLPPALYLAARAVQGRHFKAHRDQDGRFESVWKAACIALLVLIIVFPCGVLLENWIRGVTVPN